MKLFNKLKNLFKRNKKPQEENILKYEGNDNDATRA